MLGTISGTSSVHGQLSCTAACSTKLASLPHSPYGACAALSLALTAVHGAAMPPQAELLARHIVKFEEIVRDLEAPVKPAAAPAAASAAG